MSLAEAVELCTRNNAELADVGFLFKHRVNALFPFKAWFKTNLGPCAITQVYDGSLINAHNCNARADYAICARF
ncbi:hypothetical protein Q1695_003644 [Nippostrongylus brasiliensis]|nr:hypothetical protein Q1695_003644 [Nippostrongylus brasiliensis]